MHQSVSGELRPGPSQSRRAARIGSYAWAAPGTSLGLLLTVLALVGRATISRRGGVLEVAGGHFLPRMLSLFGARLEIEAITFGHVLLARSREALHQNRDHELIHVRQYERWGVLFLPLYCASSLLAFLRGKHVYRDNHFEKEAFRSESISGSSGRT